MKIKWRAKKKKKNRKSGQINSFGGIQLIGLKKKKKAILFEQHGIVNSYDSIMNFFRLRRNK